MATDLPALISNLLTATDIESLEEIEHQHQHNSGAVRHTRSLSAAIGMKTLGVHKVRLTQGHYSTEFHTHLEDEEFIYILSGRATARIGALTREVSAGDFMGFEQNSQPHNLFNPHTEDLIYLVGGTNRDIDICDYPDLDLRQFRVHGERAAVSRSLLKPANPQGKTS